MSKADYEFAGLIELALHGHRVNPRNGERRRVFCPPPVRFRSTPLVSLRTTAWKSALREMEWFLSGSNDFNDLHPSVRKWWGEWANDDDRVLYNYSMQFRRWRCPVWREDGEFSGDLDEFDQVDAFLRGIRDKPHSARHVMTTWNPPEMYADDCPITNCHGTVIQASVNGGVLDLFTYQRSADLVCGVPHNWVQYWAFLLWVAHRTGRRPGELVWQGGDVHVYAEHLDVAGRIVKAAENRHPPVPTLVYGPTSDEFKAHDFALTGPYRPVLTESVGMVV